LNYLNSIDLTDEFKNKVQSFVQYSNAGRTTANFNFGRKALEYALTGQYPNARAFDRARFKNGIEAHATFQGDKSSGHTETDFVELARNNKEDFTISGKTIVDSQRFLVNYATLKTVEEYEKLRSGNKTQRDQKIKDMTDILT
jgi:hypothetical protein